MRYAGMLPLVCCPAHSTHAAPHCGGGGGVATDLERQGGDMRVEAAQPAPYAAARLGDQAWRTPEPLAPAAGHSHPES